MVDVSVAMDARGSPDAKTTWVLQQDRWDDFGFKTHYHLFYFGVELNCFIGNVKILHLGQAESAKGILQLGSLASLGEDFCSLGQSLDYYERLASLPTNVRTDILLFLKDALIDPEHAKSFEKEKGWTTSVTRDLDLKSYRQLARILLERDYNALPSVGLELTFQATGWQAPLRLNFAAPQGGEVRRSGVSSSETYLPERIAVVTGRNGSGKSTLLARLARVLHASQGDRQLAELKRLGTIEPPGIGFSRVITITYSAFDTFQVPGTNDEERLQIIKDVRGGKGRYVFAGLRDIARELEIRIGLSGPDGSGGLDDRVALDRQSQTFLKSAEQLADEYARNIEVIFTDNRENLLLRVLKIILADPSFSDVPENSPRKLLDLDARSTFMSWSTGHKIVMHAAVILVAHTQPKSIVLVDEPESHLHPPLLAAFMHAVRTVLEQQDAFAIIATHSPVVVQETLGRHVSVVNRIGSVISIVAPRIETYGESIGEIADEVFGLHPGATDYHATFRAMVETGLNLDEIEAYFDRGLSLQARAYVMSLLARQLG